MRHAEVLLLTSLVLSPVVASADDAKSSASAGPLAMKVFDEKAAVTIDGELFGEIHFKGFPKPIVYPVFGPGGVLMVRHYPMKKGVEGEASDHPHHQSLWYTHGEVNGIDFWSTKPDAGSTKPGTGTIVCTHVGALHSTISGGVAGSTQRIAIDLENEWRASDGKVICTDIQEIGFVLLPNGDRAIDYTITLKASHGELTFGDTKEGSAGIRTNPKLRTDKGAQAVNSEGASGKSIWGKRAKWVDYAADIDGKTVGVAIFDHPSNPRHPTWWHAREYGLVAANPFGVHDFEKKPKGAGDLKVEAGKSITFKYRFLFHAGDTTSGSVAEQYETWAK